MTDDVSPDEGPEGADRGPDEATLPTRHGAPVVESLGQTVLHPDRESYIGVVEALRDEGFTVCVDVCGVDYLHHPGRVDLPAGVTGERFEVVVGLIAHDPPRRVRLRVQVPAEDPTIASLFDIHPGTEALERETYDMFGIVFDAHPDMTRILMPEDWEGHPLRKDFSVGAVPVQFKGAPPPR
jgi:NADH-quinone oxidoreductase subunit C